MYLQGDYVNTLTDSAVQKRCVSPNPAMSDICQISHYNLSYANTHTHTHMLEVENELIETQRCSVTTR